MALPLPPLKPPARIGLFSPAGPVTPRQVEEGVNLLQEVGFEICLAEHAFHRHGLVSAPAELRLRDVESLLARNVRALWALRGGYGSIHLLQSFPYQTVAEKQIWLIGFSDITALQWALFARTGLPAFSGFTLTSQFRRENPYLLPGLEILSTQRQGWFENDFPPGQLEVLIPGEAQGLLLGGTLAMIVSLAGSPFFPAVNQIILFLEDVNEPLYRLDRYLWQLKWMGFWEKVVAIILGQFLLDTKSLKIVDQLLEVLPARVPLIANFPYGHQPQCCPLPLGVPARMRTEPFVLSWEPTGNKHASN